ncbi:putative succinate dehydrogenase (quinone) [Helianthus annuus]|nr:putative succinate dehydrogenase (quinone) [Helianthus annuus]
MIYRKWSLLTGPATVVGGVAATLLALDFILKQVIVRCQSSFFKILDLILFKSSRFT